MKYACTGFRAVEADGMGESAAVFAKRMAVRRYGKRGYCAILNETARAQDGRLAEYSAFVGYSTGRNETSGHNFNFTVHKLA